MTHEVITLQFGNYSNYIGAHYWNIQQKQFVYNYEINQKTIPDINHDVLFREGINDQKISTYTPRVLLFDLKDNINMSVNEAADVHKTKENLHTWKADLKVYESERKETSPYLLDLEKLENEAMSWDKSKRPKHVHMSHLKEHYDMDEHVKYWSDYSKVKFIDRSYHSINQYQTYDSKSEPFDLYNYGLNLFAEKKYSEEYEDNLRHFSEECDQIQGFQFFVDAYNGFGGMSKKALSLISDEYPKAPVLSILSFPYFDEQAVEINTLKLINSCLTLKNLLMDETDMIVLPLSLFNSFYLSKELNPVRFHSVNYKADLNYHTSAILASVIDSITLPWRQKSQKFYMNDMVDLFDIHKYKIASLQTVFPLKINEDKYLFDYLQEHDLFKNSTWLTPFCGDNSHSTESSNKTGAFSITCRGVEDNKVKNPRDSFYFKDVISANSLLDRYSLDMYPGSRSKCFSIQTPLDVSLPYPDITDKESLKTKHNNHINEGSTNEISLLTVLQMNKSILNFIKYLTDQMESLNISKQNKYFENGMEHDDFIELRDFNKDLCDIYSVVK